MKWRILLLTGLLFSLSCTKEGPMGPEGPEGPEGPAGPAGSGSGGGTVRVITFLTPLAPVTYTWDQQTLTNTNVTFRLKWTDGAFNGNQFVLADSLGRMIDEGSLLVYAQDQNDTWHQLLYNPTGFHDLETYTYELQKTGNQYGITILADMLKRSVNQVRTPVKYRRLKFVIIPKTNTDELGWG